MAALGGVKRTRVGYCGGLAANPTYRKVCSDEEFSDWAEVIQIDFAPEELPYEDVLSHFWKSHDASFGSSKRQYMSAIFVHGDAQGEVAERMLAARPRRVATVVESATDFYQAEAYHQKWLLQRKAGLFKALRIMDVEGPAGLLDSRAAARLNAFAAGHLSAEETFAAMEALTPPSRTDWTRLATPSVLTGHVSSTAQGLAEAGELDNEALDNVRRRMLLG